MQSGSKRARPGCCRPSIRVFLASYGGRLVAQLRRRYLLPLAPLAIVWVSAPGRSAGLVARRLALVGLVGQALAVASIHPHELTYFNAAGRRSARRPAHPGRLEPRLGPGAAVARPAPAQAARVPRPDPLLLRRHRPGHYGVTGTSGSAHVIDAVDTPRPARAVHGGTRSTSPSRPRSSGAPGDRATSGRSIGEAVRMTDDTTIAIYRAIDPSPRDDRNVGPVETCRLHSASQFNKGPGRVRGGLPGRRRPRRSGGPGRTRRGGPPSRRAGSR